MTQEQRIVAAFQVVAADVKTLTTAQGSLGALTTVAQTSLVAAINELQTEINAAGGSIINDAAVSGNTTETFSANAILAKIAQVKTDILGGAAAAYDTLLELQTAIQNEETATTSILTAIGFRVRFDAAQTLTAPQQLTACTNIGVGNPDRDLVAVYVAAKA